MDADGSHQAEQLHRLLDALRTADLVIGSRYVPGGSAVNWPLQRIALSRGGNLYLRLLLGIKVKDATAGFRLPVAPPWRRSTLGRCCLLDTCSRPTSPTAPSATGCGSRRCRSSSSIASAVTPKRADRWRASR